MSYSSNLGRDRDWIKACTPKHDVYTFLWDLWISKKRFLKLYKKTTKTVFDQTNNVLDETLYNEAKKVKRIYNKIDEILRLKQRAFSYGSMYQQSEGRCVYNKDKSWAKEKEKDINKKYGEFISQIKSSLKEYDNKLEKNSELNR